MNDMLNKSEALLMGHFLLTSGMHSGHYIEKFRLLEKPIFANRVFDEMAIKFKHDKVDLVVGPAIGGIILAYGVAERLGCNYAFLERVDGKLTFRRGFEVKDNQRVLLVEDVITKGTSVREMLVTLNYKNVIGLVSMVERGDVNFGLPRQETLIRLDFPTYKPEDCPFCKAGVELTKRGSR